MKSLFVITFCVCTCTAFAQSNFVAGAITQKNGKIISGQIDYREWITTPRQIRFRASADGEANIYDCNDLKLNLATMECPSLQTNIQKTLYGYGILRIAEQYNQFVGQSL